MENFGESRTRDGFNRGHSGRAKFKFALITKPVLALLVSFGLPLAGLLFYPAFIENTLNSIPIAEKSGQHIEISRLPIFVYILVPLSISLPALTKLITGIRTFVKWEQGDSPACPNCDGPMKIRTAKKGEFRGQRFWGCYTFPACRGKEHIGW